MATPRTGAPKGPITVSNTTELRAALAAGHDAEEITVATVDVEKAKADALAVAAKDFTANKDTAVAAARNEGLEEGVKNERARLAGIQSIAMVGFEKEVAAAIESGATPEATAMVITKAAKERGVTVAALKAGAPAPVGHGGAAPATGAVENKWGSITSRFKKKGAPVR